MLITAALIFGQACAADAQDVRTIPLAPPATWGQMIGLTQDEIRTRLGLAATGETMASGGVHLESGTQVLEIPSHDLVRALCRKRGSGEFVSTNLFPHPAMLTFRDRKLVQVGPRDPNQHPIDLNQSFQVTCTARRLGPGADTALLPLAPFMIPSAIGKAVKAAKTENDWKVFGELQLGAAPPSGAQAWVAKHRNIATLTRLSDHEAQLSVQVHTDVGLMTNHALVRDGMISELKPWGWPTGCLLRTDGSLACDQKRYP